MQGPFLGLGLGLAPARGQYAGMVDFRTAMPGAATYTRTGAATGLTAAGVVQSFAADTPQRTDRGLVIEPARTNYMLRSQEFDNAAWVPTAATVTANAAIAPDGTMTAERVEFTSATLSQITQAVGGSAASYTGSVWLRTNDGTSKTVTIFNGGNVSNVTVTTAWQRLSYSNASAGSRDLRVARRDVWGSAGTADLLVWQGDVTDGAFATSPIVTTTAAATRGLPVFTEPVPAGRTKALLTYADASTTLVTGLTPGGTFDVATAVINANKGRFGSSELITREWQS